MPIRETAAFMSQAVLTNCNCTPRMAPLKWTPSRDRIWMAIGTSKPAMARFVCAFPTTQLAADLEAHTGDGSIHCDLPSAGGRVKGEHALQTKLNGGGPALLLRTGDGSISVSGL